MIELVLALGMLTVIYKLVKWHRVSALSGILCSTVSLSIVSPLMASDLSLPLPYMFVLLLIGIVIYVEYIGLLSRS